MSNIDDYFKQFQPRESVIDRCIILKPAVSLLDGIFDIIFKKGDPSNCVFETRRNIFMVTGLLLCGIN